MKATNITEDGKQFLKVNKGAFVVLLFDAEFSEQKDVVERAVSKLEEYTEKNDRVVLGIVDVEQNNHLATDLSIQSVPMVVCMQNGRVLRKIDTLEPTELIKMIEEELAKLDLISTGDSPQQADSKERFDQYLKRLTERAPIMVFMKGNPKAPRCGFSKQLVEILTRYNVIYDSFDILQDEDVRQGLKEFSQWPTYPQIYVKGEFIGGLDILKQLEEQGELESTFKV